MLIAFGYTEKLKICQSEATSFYSVFCLMYSVFEKNHPTPNIFAQKRQSKSPFEKGGLRGI
jgi:hypothetical protein